VTKRKEVQKSRKERERGDEKKRKKN